MYRWLMAVNRLLIVTSSALAWLYSINIPEKGDQIEEFKASALAAQIN
jgi:hypothetical protein